MDKSTPLSLNCRVFIPRPTTRRLEEITRSFPVVILSGARQSGKTTLLRHAFPHHNYVSMDLPSLAAQAETEPDRFLHDHPLRALPPHQGCGDADRHTMGRVLLTGSRQFRLMKGVADSLAGRCGLLDLENLSVPEINPGASVGTASSDALRAMTRGQFPKLWRLPDLPERDFHASNVATYLGRDVRQLLNVTSLRDVERFIRVLAARSGSMLNKSDVAKDVGVSVKAVGDWLSVLQASRQIILLEPWFTSFGKRVAKSPRVHFRDSAASSASCWGSMRRDCPALQPWDRSGRPSSSRSSAKPTTRGAGPHGSGTTGTSEPGRSTS